jgi:hypothetical protein
MRVFTVPLRVSMSVGMALAVLSACSIPTAAVMRADLSAVSDHATYVLAEGAAAAITLRHHGGPAVVISGCPEAPAAVLERRAATGWAGETTRGITCLGIYTMETDTVRGGASRTFSFTASRPGTYRVRVLIGTDPGAPQRSVLTNEFDVQ